jgi:hypothetical protein
LASEFAALNLADLERVTVRLERVLAAEREVILPGERIIGLRTIRKIPEIFTADEWVKIKQNHYIYELGRVCNISSDYETTIRLGLEARKREAREVLESCRERDDREGGEFLSAPYLTACWV